MGKDQESQGDVPVGLDAGIGRRAGGILEERLQVLWPLREASSRVAWMRNEVRLLVERGVDDAPSCAFTLYEDVRARVGRLITRDRQLRLELDAAAPALTDSVSTPMLRLAMGQFAGWLEATLSSLELAAEDLACIGHETPEHALASPGHYL